MLRKLSLVVMKLGRLNHLQRAAEISEPKEKILISSFLRGLNEIRVKNKAAYDPVPSRPEKLAKTRWIRTKRPNKRIMVKVMTPVSHRRIYRESKVSVSASVCSTFVPKETTQGGVVIVFPFVLSASD